MVVGLSCELEHDCLAWADAYGGGGGGSGERVEAALQTLTRLALSTLHVPT